MALTRKRDCEPTLQRKLTKKIVATLEAPATGQLFVWDEDLAGFGVRMTSTGVASYVAQYRTLQGASRRLTIGRTNTATLDEARAKARRLLASVHDGNDPALERRQARKDLTWAQVCDLYMEAARRGQVITGRKQPKRASTVAIDEGRVAWHMKPLIGNRVANTLNRADVQRMHDAIAAGKTAFEAKTDKPHGLSRVTGGAGAAARCVGLFGGIWSWSEKRGYVNGPSPANGIDKIKGGERDRILSADEIVRLGRVLRDKEALHPPAVAIVRLVAMTGLRAEEAGSLRWAEVSVAESCLRLEQTKTGRSKRVIGAKAIGLLESLPRINKTFVFPNRAGDAPAEYKKVIARIFDEAGITDGRLQCLRATFASIADEEGFSDAAIGEMLGHSKRGVTQKHYVRRPDPLMIAAVTRVSERIAALLDSAEPAGVVVSLRKELA